MFAISTPARTPWAVPRLSAAPGIVGVHVNAESGLVSDDEQGVAELADRSFERLAIEAVSLDDEGRAVAVLRQLAVHGVEPERLFLGRCWQRFARDLGGDPADELDEPGAAGVDDTRLAEHVEQLRRSGERRLSALEGDPQELS